MRTQRRGSQTGFVIYAVVLVLLLGLTSVAFTFYRPSPQVQAVSVRGAETISNVKMALIGYAARQGVFQCSDPTNATACQAQLDASTKLGELPCPDMNNDGVAEASCANASQRLGRVPWKTLGIPDPKDEAGETLWYAVSLRFLGNASNPLLYTGGRVSSGAINSSTPGDLVVLGADNSTITSAAVAVILSAGGIVSGQNRGTTTAACGTLGTIARNLCPTNYLEAQGNGNNGLAGKAFITGTPGDTFNDRLTYVSTAELIPMLEMRVGNEFRGLLLEYKYNSDCFCYPWADSWAYSGGIGDFGINRGRLASTANDDSTPAAGAPQNWGTGSIPRFPQWIFDNDWHNQVYYIASKAETHTGLGGCLICAPANALTHPGYPYITVQRTADPVDGFDRAAAVIITPGTPRPGKNRPYLPSVLASNPTLANDFTAYFEDALNQKSGCAGETVEHASTPPGSISGGTLSKCDTLVRPMSKAYDRDRIFVLKPDTDDLDTLCKRGGPALFKATPCHDPHSTEPNQVSSACTNLIGKLQLCGASCAAAATQMGVVPCRNNRSAAECPPFHAALQSCSAP
jgi:hypothetical protein